MDEVAFYFSSGLGGWMDEVAFSLIIYIFK